MCPPKVKKYNDLWVIRWLLLTAPQEFQLYNKQSSGCGIDASLLYNLAYMHTRPNRGAVGTVCWQCGPSINNKTRTSPALVLGYKTAQLKSEKCSPQK